MSRGRPFQKGQSGNPGGRPKAAFGLSSYARSKTHNGRDLIDFAHEVMTGTVVTVITRDNERVELEHPVEVKERLKAMEWLADRGFGKSVQPAPADAPKGDDEDSEDSASDKETSKVLELLRSPPAPPKETP